MGWSNQNVIAAIVDVIDEVFGTWFRIITEDGGIAFQQSTVGPQGPWNTAGTLEGSFVSGADGGFLEVNQAFAIGNGVFGDFYIYPPSGDNTGATDTLVINTVLAAGLPVQLVPTGAWNQNPYYINAPIVMPNQGRLWGWQGSDSSANDQYSAGVGISNGTVIVMVGGFTGVAAISLPDPGGTQKTGVDIRNITIEGFELSTGTIYGIDVVGAWGACRLIDVNIHRPPADCLHMVTGGTGKIPDDWRIARCKFSASRNGYGVYLAELADSWITECESSENFNDNWYVNYGVNTRFANCKGENGAQFGFHFTGIAANQTQYLVGCSTHLNHSSGFVFDNDGPSGGGLGTYVLTGCVSQQDGQSGAGTTAGFLVQGSKSRVILNGCTVDLNATGPAYGASQVTSSYYTQGTGCWFQGNTAATNDDGSNTHALDSNQPILF